MKYTIPYFLLLFCIFMGCKQESTSKVDQENRKVTIPAFSADNAYALIQEQLAMGPRHPGSPGARAAVQWIKKHLEKNNWQTELQHFDAQLFTGEKAKGVNVIGRWKPEVKERVILCAHWDTRAIADKDTIRQEEPIPGANDGASGVAVLLEIARLIAAQDLPMGVDMLFFDLEDQGEDGANNDYSWGLGSQHWAKNPHETPYIAQYGILLDMVGAKGATFYKEGFSVQNAAHVVNKVWGVARVLKKQDYFKDLYIGGITDDHRFIMEHARIPVIDIIDYREEGFMAEHHTHGDDIDIIDKSTLAAVGQVVLATLIKESNREL